jgi:two-component system, NarL family, response regulator DevR
VNQPDPRIQIFLADDHEVVRRGITNVLTAVHGFDVVGEAATVEQSLTGIKATRPDVVVLDTRLRDGSGIDVCRVVRSALPDDTYCLFLTSDDDGDALLAAVLAGASGYLNKEVRSPALVDAIRQVAAGRSLLEPQVIAQAMDQVRRAANTDERLSSLTERERDVLELIAEGLTNREIAQRLFYSEKTVKNNVSSLLRKLGLERRTQAAVFRISLR